MSATPPGPDLRFREITEADVPALFPVRTRTRENTYTLAELHALGITPESVTLKLRGTYRGWLCEHGGELVGFSMADRDGAELWVIAVLPDHEGLGVGGRLMALAEHWLWSCGCTRAWLTTDLDTSLRAYGFYRHRGWTDWKIEDGVRYMQLRAPAGSAPRTDPT